KGSLITFRGQPHYLAVVRDVTHRNRVERDLRRRLHYEHGLSELSRCLMTHSSDDSQLDRALQQVLATTGVARVCLFLNHLDEAGRPCFSMRQEACAEGVASHLGSPTLGEVQWEPELDRWHQLLQKGLPVFGDLESFATHEKPTLRARGVVSVLMLPIVADGRFLGHVVFDETRHKRTWHEADVGLLQTAVELIGSHLVMLESERVVRHSEERFRGVFETSPLGIVIVDTLNQQFLEANRSFLDIVGYTPEELAGMSVQDITHPDDWDDETRFIRRRLEGDNTTFALEKRYLRKDGQTRWVKVSGDVLALDPDRPLAVANVEDVTERRQTETALEEFFDQSSACMVIASFEGRFLRVNPEFCRAMGLTEAEMKARPFEQFVHPEDRDGTAQAMSVLADGEVLRGFRNRYVAADGEVRVLEWNSRADVERGLVYGMAIDVTDKLELEDQLRQSQKMDAIGQLAGGVAHDFNNQLAAIMGYGDMLVGRLEDADLKRYAENVLVGARRARDLTRQLLAFARKGQYQSMPVNIHQTVHEVVTILEHSIDKRIEIIRRLEASPSFTTGDPSQLQNMLLNLALNARDAMPDGGQLIIDTRVVTLDEAYCRSIPYRIDRGKYLRLSVTDTGHGMDEATRRRIFEPFFTTKVTGRGTGMGLAAVYGTVKHHGGAINVYSEPGHGTTFRLYLPLDEQAHIDQVPEETLVPAPRTATVLVVDDEELFRNFAADVLSSMGYTVKTRKNGAAAVKYFRKHHDEIDLVILDMIMPEMDGTETYDQLRRIDPGVRVLLASGYSLNGTAQTLLDRGVRGFLQKPFQQAELTQAVASTLKD
ncbi:MAG: PAS domain S-box protein, partial [Planctomycetota bacterium]